MYICNTEMFFKEGTVILYYTDKTNDSIRETQEKQQFEDDL